MAYRNQCFGLKGGVVQAVIAAKYEPPPAVAKPHDEFSGVRTPPTPKSSDSEDDGDDKDCTPGVFESGIISCSWLSDGGKEMDGGCDGKTSSEEDIGRRGDRMGVFTGVQLIDLEGGGDRCQRHGGGCCCGQHQG